MEEFFGTVDVTVHWVYDNDDSYEGDIEVTCDATRDEIRAVSRMQKGISCDDDELEKLFDRAIEMAQEELDIEDLGIETEDDEEITAEDFSWEAEITEDLDEDMEIEANSWEYYDGYPYARETVNGDTLSLTDDFQKEVLDVLCRKLRIGMEELKHVAAYMAENEDMDPDRVDNDLTETETKAVKTLLDNYFSEIFSEIFDTDEGDFRIEDGGMYGGLVGWDENFFEWLGYDVEYDSESEGRDDTYGVYYIPAKHEIPEPKNED